MSKIYNKLGNNFTLIPNNILLDTRVSALSFKIYSYICYRIGVSQEWEFYNREMASHFKEGIKAFIKAKKELEQFGYLEKIRQNKNGEGKWEGCDYIIHKDPFGKPIEPVTPTPLFGMSAKRTPAERTSVNGITNKTDINKTDINKKEENNLSSVFLENEEENEDFILRCLEGAGSALSEATKIFAITQLQAKEKRTGEKLTKKDIIEFVSGCIDMAPECYGLKDVQEPPFKPDNKENKYNDILNKEIVHITPLKTKEDLFNNNVFKELGETYLNCIPPQFKQGFPIEAQREKFIFYIGKDKIPIWCCIINDILEFSDLKSFVSTFFLIIENYYNNPKNSIKPLVYFTAAIQEKVILLCSSIKQNKKNLEEREDSRKKFLEKTIEEFGIDYSDKFLEVLKYGNKEKETKCLKIHFSKNNVFEDIFKHIVQIEDSEYELILYVSEERIRDEIFFYFQYQFEGILKKVYFNFFKRRLGLWNIKVKI